MTPRFKTIARSLAAKELDTRIIDERGKRANGVGATTHASDHHVGQSSLSGEQLSTRLIANDTLEVAHEFRERVRTRSGTEDVVGRLDVGHPVTESLVDRILEGRRTRSHGDDLGAKHLHACDVQGLTLSILSAHVDRAFQAQKRRGRRRGHAVLSRAGLRNDAGLSQLLGEQRLPKHVVNLVRPRMVQILALEEDTHATQVCSETGGLRQQGGTSRVVQEQIAQAALE